MQTLRLGFDAAHAPIAMDHAAVAGWPVLAIVPEGLLKGTNGALYDPYSIAGADRWYEVGVQQVRATNNDASTQI